MNRITALITLLLVACCCFSQEYQSYDAPYTKAPKKKAFSKITIETFDGSKYRGKLVTIGYDYLLFDAKKYNSPASLRPYYVRPQDDYYKIDVEYLKSARVSTGRSMGVSTFRGTVLGVFLAGMVSLAALKGEIWFDSFEEWAITSGVIVGIGTTAGFIGGLVRRKKVMIDGNTSQLRKLNDFFYN